MQGAGKDTGINAGLIARVCKRFKNTGFNWNFVHINPNEQGIDLTNFI